MAAADTKESILDAAEQLFAVQGIPATSLRAITSVAGTNLASVNYHFGSKEGLIRAVFDRRLEPINQRRLELLSEAEAEGPPSLERILHAFVAPVFEADLPAEAISNVARIFGRVPFDADEGIQDLMVESFRGILDRFLVALAAALPELSPSDLMWRFHFGAGAISMTVSNPGMIARYSDGQCDVSDPSMVVARLVNFLAAGYRAPRTVSTEIGG